MCLSSAMSSVKELLTRRKKLCISHDEVGPAGFVESNNVSSASDLASGKVKALTTSQCPEVPVVPLPLPLTSRVATRSDVTPNCERDHINEGDEMNLAQHHPRRQNCQLPMWYRDILPQPPPTIPLEMCEQLPGYVGSVIAPEQPALPVHAVFCTLPNIFGLVWQYFSLGVPSHGPEEYITLTDLSFIPAGNPQVIEKSYPLAASTSDSQYHPYPNLSSFKLSEWYWNQGLQKSQEDYMKLLQILGGEAFSAADVSSTCWRKINYQLRTNEYDKADTEWEDEDAGWKRTAITIQVPFSRTTEIPGSQLHEAAYLYHHSLVAVLREKLANT
jgi:hypothetical protein